MLQTVATRKTEENDEKTRRHSRSDESLTLKLMFISALILRETITETNFAVVVCEIAAQERKRKRRRARRRRGVSGLTFPGCMKPEAGLNWIEHSLGATGTNANFTLFEASFNRLKLSRYTLPTVRDPVVPPKKSSRFEI